MSLSDSKKALQAHDFGPFIDFLWNQKHNDNMRRMCRYLVEYALGAGMVGMCLGTFSPEAAAQLNKPAAVYYCPDRTPDQQYSDRPAPGCIPLVDKEEEAAKAAKKEAAKKKGQELKERIPVLVENLEREISAFVRDYRKFLDCCVNTPDSLETVEELEDRAAGLLKDVQDTGLVNMGTGQRGMTLSQLIPPVAQAKLDLGKLRKKLESLDRAKDKLGDLDYETAGRERRRIQEEEDALKKEFRPTRPPDSAKTGLDVGDTTLPNRFGTDIGGGNTPATTLPNATGTDIGTVVSPGSDQQQDLRPRPGLDTQDTTLPNYRVGPDTQDTTLPYSFGTEIDRKQNPSGTTTTPSRVGPNVGDSTLNERR
ncbi:MAG: hypothetical protein HY444_03670 [Nitrospirae bacterium]|nr:hypothetical protein [Nitrospirota bacterium]